MKRNMRMVLSAVVVLLLVAVFMVQSSFAEQHVMCLKQVQVDITSKLPDGFWQTPQVGNLVKKQLGNIGGKQTLMCGYKVYNSIAFIMHEMPAGTQSCKADVHGFVCK